MHKTIIRGVVKNICEFWLYLRPIKSGPSQFLLLKCSHDDTNEKPSICDQMKNENLLVL